MKAFIVVALIALSTVNARTLMMDESVQGTVEYMTKSSYSAWNGFMRGFYREHK